jgi:hypothetical protein
MTLVSPPYQRPLQLFTFVGDWAGEGKTKVPRIM